MDGLSDFKVSVWENGAFVKDMAPSEMSDEDLLYEFATEYWAADRCVGVEESERNTEAQEHLKAEILRRMKSKPKEET